MNVDTKPRWLRPQWWWPLPAGMVLGIALRLIFSGGTTALHVAISYRVSTRFNWYAGRVAELLVGNFEQTVLRFYARRAEAQATSG